MKTNLFKRVLGVLFLTLTLISCGSKNESPADPAAAAPAPAPRTSNAVHLSSFGDDVRACTPDLSSSSLSNWSNWDMNQQYGHLAKVFTPGTSPESLYGPVDKLDENIYVINLLGEYLNSEGSYNPVVTVDIQGEQMTFQPSFTIEFVNGLENVPYFGGNEPDVNRKITLHYEFPDQSGDVVMYFGINEATGAQTIIAKTNELEGELVKNAGASWAKRDPSTGDFEIRTASINDKNKNDGALEGGFNGSKNDFMVNSHIVGNTISKIFKISIKTNCDKGTATMAGGSVATDDSIITVRATNAFDSDYNANDELGVEGPATDGGYYVQLSKAEIYAGTDMSQFGYPKAVGVNEANLAAEADYSKHYAMANDNESLGWTQMYPDLFFYFQ